MKAVEQDEHWTTHWITKPDREGPTFQARDVLHRMAVLQTLALASARASASVGVDDESELLALSQKMPADETQLLYSLCLHGRAELHLSPDEYAALTMVLLLLLGIDLSLDTDQRPKLSL